MPSQPVPARPLPGGLLVIGSMGVLVHLAAVLVLVLAARSGPWIMPAIGIPSEAEPPEFIKGAGDLASGYLESLHLAHNYHFVSSQPELSQVFFEVRLKDSAGKPVTDHVGNPMVLKFPDSRANFWVRHRQTLLARGLGDDQPIPLGPSPRTPDPQVEVWWAATQKDEQRFTKKSESELMLRRSTEGIPVFYSPSKFSLLLAKSYARQVCSEQRAAVAEIVRHSREPIPPVILLPGVRPENEFFQRTFESFVCNFGEERGK